MRVVTAGGVWWGGAVSSEHAERCPSGRMGTPGERVYLHRYRGFESLPLR